MGSKKKKQAVNEKKRKKAAERDNRRDNSSAEIAKAEKKLERALRKLDEVRSELAEREMALRNLLIKHGRMPAGEPTSSDESVASEPEATYPLDSNGDSTGEDVERAISVPLLDQRQVLDVGSREPVSRDE